MLSSMPCIVVLIAFPVLLQARRLGVLDVHGAPPPAEKEEEDPCSKFIATVPVLNYCAAYGGRAGVAGFQVQADEEENWMFVLSDFVSEEEKQRICESAKNGCKLMGRNVPILELHGTEADIKAVLETTASQGKVKLIEPEKEMYAIPEIPEPGDDALTAQQALWGLARINAAGRPTRGNGVTIFVLDTGVRTTHQDFGGRAIPTLDCSKRRRAQWWHTWYSPTECNGGDTTCAVDNQGHGTHCAGTAAGTSLGVAPSATVRGMKVLGDDGRASLAWGIEALDWIVSSNIRPAVASMSLGAAGVYSSMATAINTATEAGVTVVVAGGNDNRNACEFTPAHVPSAITVGSTTSLNKRSDFSNYGSCTDMWAPGSEIRSAGHESDTAEARMSGTSMACPHVSGGAALVLEQNPTFKADQVTSKLLANAWADTLGDLRDGDTNKELYVGACGGPMRACDHPVAPTPTPAPHPKLLRGEIEGQGCQEQDDCLVSTGWPSNYGNSQYCKVDLSLQNLYIHNFRTEGPDQDILYLNSFPYSGGWLSGPPTEVRLVYNLEWRSSFITTDSGWKICTWPAPSIPWASILLWAVVGYGVWRIVKPVFVAPPAGSRKAPGSALLQSNFSALQHRISSLMQSNFSALTQRNISELLQQYDLSAHVQDHLSALVQHSIPAALQQEALAFLQQHNVSALVQDRMASVLQHNVSALLQQTMAAMLLERSAAALM